MQKIKDIKNIRSRPHVSKPARAGVFFRSLKKSIFFSGISLPSTDNSYQNLIGGWGVGGRGLIFVPFEKWSNYVYSCILGTDVAKVTPLWAATEHLLPGQCGQHLSRIMLQILLDRVTLGFSLSIPFKDFKCYGGRGDSGFQVTGVIERFFGG